MKKCISILALLAGLQFSASAQNVGFGMTVINDWYSWIQNPSADGGGNAGNALLNLGLGPKIWLGGQDVSVSVEAAAVLGFTTLDWNTYKGMGAAYFPIMAKLNFGGMTGLDKEGEFGWYLGFGTQYTRTELYGVRQSFEDTGGSRSLFDTYIAQVGYGFGMSGFAGSVFGKYGWNADTDARLISVGLQFDFNWPMIKKISSPESSL
jgi:hypothetical protein